MDLRNPTRFRPYPSSSADRFIAVFPQSSSAATDDEDLTEDDIFSSIDISSRIHSHHQNHLSSSPSFPSSRHPSAAFSPLETSSSGILAALPDNDLHHIFNHKVSALASAASSASSSSTASLLLSPISASRLIPSVPKPLPQLNERFLGKYLQSAPVNVPVLANLRRGGGGFVDDEFDEVEEEEEEVLRPPHEIVARRSERLACSVLEGAGRTLKGRDLRQVRNAVWRQTANDVKQSSTLIVPSGIKLPRSCNFGDEREDVSPCSVVRVAHALVNLELSYCFSVKGKVTCLDCEKGHDLSGIRVLVKCDKVKKPSVRTTSRTGFFQAELPKDSNVPRSSNPPTNCFAHILGGSTQIYASDKNMVSKVVKAYQKTSLIYMTMTPLAISTTRPPSGKATGRMIFGSSKTFDFPVPPEWGLAPTSYYTPFIPIIGIP